MEESIPIEKIYENRLEFFQNVFTRKTSLAGHAVKLYDMITNGNFLSRKWKFYVSETFGAYPPTNDEKKILDEVLELHFGNDSNPKKPFMKLLEKNNKKEIELSDDELFLVKKAFSWNSAVSGYYSILKKFKSMGLIKRKGPFYVLSEEFPARVDSLKRIFQIKSSEEDNV